jgi:hypothetical protein
MTGSTVAALQKKNDDLRQLVIRLGTILLGNIAQHRALVEMRGAVVAPMLLAATMPGDIVGHLREMALRCGEISRDCCNPDVAHALEGLSVEFATEAEALEELLRVHKALRLSRDRPDPAK